MVKEPDLKSAGEGGDPHFSIESQLKLFREQLDGERKITKVVPGYLFRDGRERSREFTLAQLKNPLYSFRWGSIDEELLALHAETYRKALEARNQLVGVIRPAEIIEMVREVWSKGETTRTRTGATLTYSYLTLEEERSPSHYIPRRNLDVIGNMSTGGYMSSGPLTGKWFAYRAETREEVDVGFPPTESAPREFFADYYSGNQHIEFPYTDLPKDIWYKPDNLVISVTVPYVAVRVVRGYYYRSDHKKYFDQNTSQQEVMDYLAQQLETQRKVGQLPSQIEAVELAKIEELRRRGLFTGVYPEPPIYTISPTW